MDEIHALARDKRGSHLTLSLERLEHIQQEGRPQRVGLSATQRPIEVTARILSGAVPRRVVVPSVPVCPSHPLAARPSHQPTTRPPTVPAPAVPAALPGPPHRSPAPVLVGPAATSR